MAVSEGTEPELRKYLRILGRRKWIVILTAAVVTLAALGISFAQTQKYQAKAVLLLQPNPVDVFNPNSPLRYDPQRQVDTEIQILKSAPIASVVRSQVGVEPDVTVSELGQTDTVQIVATDTIAERAARVANSYANAYIAFRRSQNLNSMVAVGTQIQSKIHDLQTQISQLDQQIAAEPAAQRASSTDPLVQQEKGLVDQESLFSERLQELQVDQGALSSEAQLVTAANAPSSPSSPKPLRNGLLALFGGLIFGVALAFTVDYLDDSIKVRDDIERLHADVPVVGVIPTVGGWRNHSDPVVVSITDPRSNAAESYRALRTSIQFMGLDRPVRSLLVTSPSASEGKSATVANLAVALSRAGQRVIIACCDLRRPRIHDYFGLSNEIGFTSVLLGDIPLSSALQDVPNEERLQVLASGPIPPNPSELLAGRRAVEVITALQTEADIVIVDAPPVLPVTDPAILSSRVDAVLLVASSGRTTRRAVRHAISMLRQVDAPLVGIVLNRVAEETSYVYRYGGVDRYAALTHTNGNGNGHIPKAGDEATISG